MSQTVVVHKNRTNTLLVSLGYDVSNDVLVSEIRQDSSVNSKLIATWDVDFLNDGTDGELKLTLDDTVTSEISVEDGFMDIKRITNGEPVSVFNEPLKVVFRGVVTR